MNTKDQIKAIFSRLRVQLEIAEVIALRDLELHHKTPEFESGGIVSKLPDGYEPFSEEVIPAKYLENPKFVALKDNAMHCFASKKQRDEFMELIKEEE